MQKQTREGHVSLDWARSLVAWLGDHLVLYRLLLFVDHAQRLIGLRIHQIHADLAELAVARLVGGAIGEHVLVPEALRDGLEDSRELAVEAREERHATGFLGERPQLIV